MDSTYDYGIIGGGIIGLATAYQLSRAQPNARILLIEKEPTWAAHQTGHNSGVIHSGIYYKPGSAKARLAVQGRLALERFCEENALAYERCGKLIVATKSDELPRLQTLAERAAANGIEAHSLSAQQITDIEPHARGLAALHVPATGIVDYKRVAQTLATLAQAQGAMLCTNTRLLNYVAARDSIALQTTQGDFTTKFLINTGGLYSDKIAALSRQPSAGKIIPFRGEYYELVPERQLLVRNLIYPVPNPQFPFLGVHFTRMIDGSVHAGPNAVLALCREGYRKTDIQLSELWETLSYPPFWKLASAHAMEGIQEILRSLSKTLFVRSMQALIPEIRAADAAFGLAPPTGGKVIPLNRVQLRWTAARRRHTTFSKRSCEPCCIKSICAHGSATGSVG